MQVNIVSVKSPFVYEMLLNRWATMHLWWAATMVTMSLVTLGGLTWFPCNGGGAFPLKYNLEASLTSMLQAADRAALASVFPCCDGERGGQDGDVWRGRQHRAEHQD